jgi:hypothetical protein
LAAALFAEVAAIEHTAKGVTSNVTVKAMSGGFDFTAAK